MPDDKNNYFLVLTSSNYRKEYITDAIEDLCLPRGYIQHHRYQLKWLKPELRGLIPLQKDAENCDLLGSELLLAYLYQEKVNDKEYEWKKILPLRFAKLEHCYKTGNSDNDIAHFYFSLDSHVKPNSKSDAWLNNIVLHHKGSFVFAPDKAEKKDPGLPAHVKEKQDKSAFIETCDLFFKDKEDYFKSPDKKLVYTPIFCYLSGIRDGNDNLVPPKLFIGRRKSYYELYEGNLYYLEYHTYFPKDPKKYKIEVKTDERAFSNDKVYTVESDCRYDEDIVPLTPFLRDHEVSSVIEFTMKYNENEPDKVPLELRILLGVNVRKSALYRNYKICGDILPVIGVALLSFAAGIYQTDKVLFYVFLSIGIVNMLAGIMFKVIYANWGLPKKIGGQNG